MAADNAIIIGLIAANYAPNNRKKIIAWGVAAAFIFRIIFAFGASYMFEYAWIKILGGVLLLWVINNLRQDFFNQKKVRSPQTKSNETKSFMHGFRTVLIADLTLSFDNVLGVVGAAKDNYHLLVVGLLLSVFLIVDQVLLHLLELFFFLKSILRFQCKFFSLIVCFFYNKFKIIYCYNALLVKY